MNSKQIDALFCVTRIHRMVLEKKKEYTGWFHKKKESAGWYHI